MGQADRDPADHVEILDVGQPHDRRSWTGGRELPPRARRWVTGLLGGGLAVGLVLWGLHTAGEDGAPPAAAHPTGPAGTSSASSSASSSPGSTDGAPLASAVSSALGRPLLGTTSRWEVFGRADDEVVRIQPALGRVTRTPVPALSSGGPVSFLVTSGAAVIRPLDLVPGYLVPDDRPSRPMPAVLATSGPMLPGPDPDHLWAPSATADDVLALVGMDGRPTGRTVTMPAGTSTVEARPDGGGYLLVDTAAGVFDVRPDGAHRIPGLVQAVGPTGWLTAQCDSPACALALVDRAGHSRRVPGSVLHTDQDPGVIAPDGATAAVLPAPTGFSPTPVRLSLLDLTTGVLRPVALPLPVTGPTVETLVWSPDSRWIFCLDQDGNLRTIDARTAAVVDLGLPLPHLSQLAVRNGRA